MVSADRSEMRRARRPAPMSSTPMRSVRWRIGDSTYVSSESADDALDRLADDVRVCSWSAERLPCASTTPCRRSGAWAGTTC
jgi:hypothetical protein